MIAADIAEAMAMGMLEITTAFPAKMPYIVAISDSAIPFTSDKIREYTVWFNEVLKL